MRFALKCGKCGNADPRITSGKTAFLRFATPNGVQLRNPTRAVFAKVCSISTCVNAASGQFFGPPRQLSPEILSSRPPRTQDSAPEPGFRRASPERWWLGFGVRERGLWFRSPRGRVDGRLAARKPYPRSYVGVSDLSRLAKLTCALRFDTTEARLAPQPFPSPIFPWTLAACRVRWRTMRIRIVRPEPSAIHERRP